MSINKMLVTGNKLRKRKLKLKTTKIVLLVLFFFLISAFLILQIIYKGGRFTITLDPIFSLHKESISTYGKFCFVLIMAKSYLVDALTTFASLKISSFPIILNSI